MGHSVSPTGFRLQRYRNWKGSTPLPIKLLSLLDWFFLCFFREVQSFNYSHFRYAVSPLGLCSISLYLYSPVWQLLLDRLQKGALLSEAVLSLYLRSLRFKLLSLLSLLLTPLLSQFPIQPLLCTPLLVDRPSVPALAPLLSRFLARTLKRGRTTPFPRVLNTLLDQSFLLFKKVGVLGLFVRAAGRFSRTQRASSLAVRRGKTPFSSLSTGVDRFSSVVTLKYGRCSLHLSVAYETV